MKEFIEMPKDRNDLDGKENFYLVEVIENRPTCKVHGAMNKVSKEVWRCLSQYGKDNPKEGETIGKFRDRVCNACCLETGNTFCVNCGKTENNHYLGTEDRIGGTWCCKFSTVKPKDEEYFMSFKEGSQSTGSGKQ